MNSIWLISTIQIKSLAPKSDPNYTKKLFKCAFMFESYKTTVFLLRVKSFIQKYYCIDSARVECTITTLQYLEIMLLRNNYFHHAEMYFTECLSVT